MPQQRKEGEIERLRGDRDQIRFIDLGFERWQSVATSAFSIFVEFIGPSHDRA